MSSLKDTACEDKHVGGIIKIASFVFSNVEKIDAEKELVKLASSKMIDGSSEAEKVLKEEMAKRPNALFFRAKAIEANIPNNNGDYFGVEELKRSAQTFIGVPFFTNHQNDDVEKAKGKVVYAEWEEKDKSIYVIAFIDRQAYPHLCRGIEQEYVSGVSMGAVSAGTLVWACTDSGCVQKPIEEVRVGDLVLSHKSRPKKVKKVHEEFLGTPMVNFTLTTYHKSPWFTEDHPIYTIDGKQIDTVKSEHIKLAAKNKYQRRKGQTEKFVGQDGWRNETYTPSFVEAGKIEDGDHVLIPSKYSIKETSSYDQKLYYLIGLYLGDGYVKIDRHGQPEAVSFCIGGHEKELSNVIFDILQLYSIKTAKELECKERNGRYISIYDRKLARFFKDHIGSGCKRKRLNKLPIENRQDAIALLSGYLDTDGCIVNKTNQDVRGTDFGGFQISSANISLLEDVQNLLIGLGYVSRISSFVRTPSESSVVNVETIENTLAIGSNSYEAFSLSNKLKSSSVACAAQIKAGATFVTDINGTNYMACPVLSVNRKERWDEPVYDLTVDGDESYIADGVAVHNCSVEYSTCSICRKKATSQEEYCYHVRNLKGRTFSGQAKDVITGETKTFKNAPVYEDNYGIRFIELSGVVDPACASCKIDNVFDNTDFLKAAATNCYNGLAMFKTSEVFEKTASEQDINRLNETLSTLQDIAIKLIQQRESIEMEFSSDLVKILADLQEYVDSLVQAGFGRLPDIPGVAPGQEAPVEGVPETGGMELGAPPLGGEQQIAVEEPLAPGSMSGELGKPLTEVPAGPATAQLEKMRETTRPTPGGPQFSTIQRPVSPRRASQEGESDKVRRLPKQTKQQKERITGVLESNWQEKLEKVSNVLKESLAGDVSSDSGDGDNTGGLVMASVKEAKAKETPNVVIETQLDTERGGKHPRTDDVKEDVLGKQVATEHEGKEPNEIEQGLLEGARTGGVPDEVGQNQLEPLREGEVEHKILDKHLDGTKVGTEPNSTIEDLLSHPKVDTPSTRTASLKEHIEAAVDILARTVICAQSTPKRVAKVAGSLAVLPLSEQVALAKSITEFDGNVPAFDNFKERIAYWNTKGLQTTSASDKQLKEMIVSLAGQATSEKSLDSELLVRAFGVLKGSGHTEAVLSDHVQELMESDELVSASDLEDEMDKYLASMIASEEVSPEAEETTEAAADEEVTEAVSEEVTEAASEEETVKAETDALADTLEQEAVKDSSLIIETSYDEMGVPEEARGNDEEVKHIAAAFARGACAHLGEKLSAVVNVTVDAENGDIVIAVDTEGGAVEIPVGGEEELIIEEPEDLGEGLAEEPIAPPAEEAAAAPELGVEPGGEFGATTPAPEAGGLGSFTSSKKKVKTAQFGGGDPGAGAGGALPDQGGAGGAVGMDPSLGIAGPGEGEGLQSFTGEEEELPGDDEQMMPGTICPICGSTDTETGRKDQVSAQFDCNACGAKYIYAVQVEILNPQELLGEEKEDLEGELENPEVATMPVAAMIELDRNSFKKISEIQKEVGHVCPACGSIEVDVEGEPTNITMACKKCTTKSEKTVLINVDNPVESKLRISWSLDPMKRKCGSCKKNAKRFAADRVFGKLMKRAETLEIPEDKIRAWLAANYDGVEVVSNGAYKGQSFADTIVGQVKRFGLLKMKHLKKLADTQSEDDPMEACLKKQKKNGYTLAESRRLCNCMKEKHAGEEDANVYMEALAGMIDTHILRKMAEADVEKELAPASEISEEASIFDLPEAKPVEEATSTAEVAASLQEEVALFPAGKEDAKAEEAVVSADSKQKKVEAAADGITKLKRKKNKEKKVKDVDGDMSNDSNEKPKASRSTIGNEDAIALDDPDVPRSKATMGNEDPAPAEGVSIPSEESGIDTRMLGNQAESEGKMEREAFAEQETMGEGNDEVKNPDDTSGDTALDEKSDTEKQVSVVESIEAADDVPRGDATIGDEEALTEGGPDVPRANATMGNEAPPKEEKVTIPSEVSDTDVTMRGREADRQHQLDKIASARREHAMRFAGQLIERGVIKEAELDTFVADLVALPLDRMKAHVAILMKQKTLIKSEVSAAIATPVLSTPIIKESQTEIEQVVETPLSDKLANMFTIGGRNQNRAIRMDMADRAREDEEYPL